MKKFLTVLLVIAVMFTFSFSSAFAVNATDVVADRTAAVQKITEKYNAELLKVNNALANAKAGTKYPTTATQAEWNAACDEAFEAVKAQLDIQLSEAYQELGRQEVAASAYSGGIQGYEFASAAPGTADGYVYFKSALDKINVGLIDGTSTPGHKTASVTYVTADGPVKVWDGAAFVIATTNPANGIDASKIMYENALAATKTLIESYDIEKFSKEDKVTVGTTTKTSYEWIVAKKADALAALGAFGDYGAAVSASLNGVTNESTYNKAAVEDVYKVNAAGTEGENYEGRFYGAVSGKFPAISALKTTQTSMSDAARIDYAKTQALTAIKQTIETKRAEDLKVQNDIIFAQSIATKPNQKVIDDAKEAIEDINEKYDGMIEIFEARFANAEYRVTTDATYTYVRTYYNDEAYEGLSNVPALGLWYNVGGSYYPQGKLANIDYGKVTDILSETDAEAILDNIAVLKKKAASLKATIEVDGATALDIDKALEDAIADEYMKKGAGKLDYAMSNTVVHNRAHALLGYTCTGANIADKVTVDGKKYDRVDDWATTGYSKNNTIAVKAIIKEAKAAIKAAATVEDADKAFLDAYAKYDAVLTTNEQAALFNYGGALYKQDVAAKAELAAYIDYKVSLQGDKKAGTNTAAAIKEFFNIDTTTSYVEDALEENFLAEVVDAASLQTAIADVKATVDALLTKDEVKAKGAELTAKVNGISRAVALTQEADVLALYDEVMDYKSYCAMVNYTYPMAAQEALLKTDIERLEDLQLAALNDMKDALPTVAKLTLDDADAVSAFYEAQKVYNATYGIDSDGVRGDYADALVAAANYNDASAYDAKIWNLKLEAVDALIAALPVNATAEQVKAAREALEALGFEGICGTKPDKLTKLSKFEQDVEFTAEDAKAYVQDLKIAARSVKTSKGVKVTIKADVQELLDNGFTVEYKFYRSTKSNAKFGSPKITKTTNTYLNTSGKKGTRYYYKARLVVKNAKGEVVAITPLSQCLYATRTF